MGDIINFPEIGNISLSIPRTEDFDLIAEELTELIKKLPLTPAQNDNLIYKIVEQLTEAERGAFMQGFNMGASITQGET